MNQRSIVRRAATLLFWLPLASCGSPGSVAPTPPPPSPPAERYVGPLTSPIVYVANQWTNDVSAYLLDDDAGTLTPVSENRFRAGTTPSALAVSPTGRVVLVTHTGSNDVWAYTRDPDGALMPSPGSPYAVNDGPLHAVAFDPDSRYAYVLGSRISVYSFDRLTGALAPIPAGPYRVSEAGSACGDGPALGIAVSRKGLLYATGANCVVAYAIDEATGDLSLFAHSVVSVDNEGLIAAASYGVVLSTEFSQPPSTVSRGVTPRDLVHFAVLNPRSGAPVPGPMCCSSDIPYFNLGLAAHPILQSIYVTGVSRDTGAGTLRSFAVDIDRSPSAGDIPIATLFGTATLPAGLGPVALGMDPKGYFVVVANGEDVVRTYKLGKNSGLPNTIGPAVPTGARPIAVAVSRPRETD